MLTYYVSCYKLNKKYISKKRKKYPKLKDRQIKLDVVIRVFRYSQSWIKCAMALNIHMKKKSPQWSTHPTQTSCVRYLACFRVYAIKCGLYLVVDLYPLIQSFINAHLSVFLIWRSDPTAKSAKTNTSPNVICFQYLF